MDNVCAACGYEGQPGNVFCESCGETLAGGSSRGEAQPPSRPTLASPAPAPALGACSCGAGPDKRDKDGVCSVCGEMTVADRAHQSFVVDQECAAVCDIGLRHYRNEDAVAIAREGSRTILIVSDGVSSAQDGDKASALACQTILNYLRGHQDLAAPKAVERAIATAQKAVCALPHTDPSKEPPEATVVVALLEGRHATLGWLGDSRVYVWDQHSPQPRVQLLTKDHSWVNCVVEDGLMTVEAATADKRSHAITQSLGRLPEGETLDISVREFDLAEWTHVVVCTDGFWNYAHPLQYEPPSGIAEILAKATPAALDLAKACVDFALAQGGRDNISVALAALPERTSL